MKPPYSAPEILPYCRPASSLWPHFLASSKRPDILTVSTALVDVRRHGLLGVLRTDVALSGEEERNVILGSVQNGGELGGHVGDDELVLRGETGGLCV